MQSILLIDDDVELGELLQEFLALEGFRLTAVHNGKAGLEAANSGRYDLILLDVMLPGLNGFDVLKQLRQHSSVPVIMLTARGDSDDRVLGLEFGADDYVPKPYHHHELLARIKALFRRIELSAVEQEVEEVNEYQVANLTVHTTRRQALLDDHELPLTGAEFGVLLCLMEQAGDLVDKEALSQAALGRSLMAFDRSIDMHVSNLRKKLGTRADGSDWIKTVRSRGYQLVRD